MAKNRESPVEKHTLFFQLAAALIPALLFGGLASERFAPPKSLPSSKKRGRLLLVGLVVALLCALAAEWFAIELSFAESPALWKVPIVVFVLVAATACLAGALLYPWLRAIWPQAAGVAFLVLFAAATVGNLALSRSVYDALALSELQRSDLARQLDQRANEDRRRDYVEIQDLIDDRGELNKRKDLTATDRRLLNDILDERLLGLVQDSLAEREVLDRRREYPHLVPVPAP